MKKMRPKVNLFNLMVEAAKTCRCFSVTIGFNDAMSSLEKIAVIMEEYLGMVLFRKKVNNGLGLYLRNYKIRTNSRTN